MKTTEQKPHGTIAREAIQCVCPDTGALGSFLFTGESHRNKGSRVSPVCADLAELYIWARENGWVSEGGARVFRGCRAKRDCAHKLVTRDDFSASAWCEGCGSQMEYDPATRNWKPVPFSV